MYMFHKKLNSPSCRCLHYKYRLFFLVLQRSGVEKNTYESFIKKAKKEVFFLRPVAFIVLVTNNQPLTSLEA